MQARRFRVLMVAVLLVLVGATVASAQTKLLRFPDISGDKVVFTYAGDLWLASASGGTAWRLTAHPGLELFAKFSPDGQWIAFTGQYDGDEQVYVVPVTGGAPKQLTYYPAKGPFAPRWGFDNQVYDWTRDGSGILFRAMRYGYDLSDTRLFKVPVEGGLPEPLPMPISGAGDLSPDGTQVVYSPLVRDFRTWKRYEGGWAQELYIFDLDSFDFEQITDHPRADRDPMWIGGKIYFTSDRDDKNNLYAYDTLTKVTEQVTAEDTWDIRWPSDDGEGQIVYELDGELQIFDIAAARSRSLSIVVPDDGLYKRPAVKSVGNQIEGFALSPKGERALIVARGDVFTAPIEKGPTRNLTESSSAHDKWASWSPDGREIAFISDGTGEEEIYIVDQDGSGEPEQLTDNGEAMRYTPIWAPDGERISFTDKNGKLWVVDVGTKQMTLVADDEQGAINAYAWSPNGGHLAFILSETTGYGSIHIWSVGEETPHKITSELFNEFDLAWDPEGNYLYYLSDREYTPQISSIEWNFATDRETFIYALALRDDVAHPLPPESDEVTLEEDEDKEEAEEEGEVEKAYVEIDFEGLSGRVARIPVESDNYGNLNASKGFILYSRGGPFYYGRSSDIKTELKIFSFEDREGKTLAEDIQGYALSSDGSKALVRHSSGFKLYDVSTNGKDSAKEVSTANLKSRVVPQQEWAQIFDEVWRRYRDFFYVENMHGYDWAALRDQYRPWLEHVGHRSDLNYLIGEMIAELSVGHAYVEGGDYDLPKRHEVALPGAEFELDSGAGHYRIAKILPGHNEEDQYRSPLTEIGVDVQVGDYVLAIDDEELTGGMNPYQLLRDKADRPVGLTVNSAPTISGARKVTFNPITAESRLRYLAWVEGNYDRVQEMTGGRVGYMHIPDMGDRGLREFVKWYFPQLRKEGLIVDVRGNGGGNVSQMLIERLGRKPLGTGFGRNSEVPDTYPGTAFYGHMACLLDEDSASDGDIFPFYFREAGLGPLIGKRTWGGVVGIGGRGPLIDGGTIYVPEFSTNDMQGNWIIEGLGVEPDIEVENDPKSILEGRDPQLERGVEEVMKSIESEPRLLPTRAEPPVKTE
ncbi:MAG: S41 family peptidase [Thermoanaerobaculia bacterium]